MYRDEEITAELLLQSLPIQEQFGYSLLNRTLLERTPEHPRIQIHFKDEESLDSKSDSIQESC